MGLTRPRAHQLQDIDYKQTARAVTVANVTLSGGAPATVDGVSLALRDRVLVTAQTTGSENGIYYVTTVGAGSNGTWARSLDADATGEIKAGTIIMITEGTTYADTQWKLTTDDPITVGSTTMTFVRAGNAAYGTIAVSGQNSIIADQIGDTLTMVPGTNLVLTTNDGTDTLTITPSLTPALTSLTTTGNITATGNVAGGNVLTGNLESSGNIGYNIQAGFGFNNFMFNGTVGLELAVMPDYNMVYLKVPGSNIDFSIKGNDGGSEITALSFDMSDKGAATFNSDVVLNTSGAKFQTYAGALEIYYSGDAYIDAGGLTDTGDLIIQQTNDDHDILIKSDDGSAGLATYFQADGSTGEAKLFHYGSEKFTTSSTGATVTGNLSVTGQGTFLGNVAIPDSKFLQIGTDADFSLHHDGTNSIIRSASNRTWIQTDTQLEITKNNGAEYMARFLADSYVELWHNNSPKFRTLDTGIRVIGNLETTGGGITSSEDIIIDATSSNHDIIFKGNDGGSVITALTLDMSTAGAATFNNNIILPSGGVQAGTYFWGAKTDGLVLLYAGANFEVRLTHVHNTGFLLNNFGTGTPAVELQFVDANESIGSDGTNLLLTSGGSIITVPASAGNLVVDAATQTLTNKTLTNPTINAFTGTGDGSITGTLSIANTTTDDSLLITTTEDSSTAAPVITLKRNSASPADADYLGQLKFKGENDADQEVVYAKITGKIQDASDGSEDGLLEFANRKAGSNNIGMRLRSDSLQLLNGTSFTVAGTSTLTGNVSIEDASSLLLYDTDSSNYIGFKAPGTVTTNVTYTLPADGSSGQVLQTNGSGTLSFVDQSGGGEGGSSFPNCTVTPLPSS